MTFAVSSMSSFIMLYLIEKVGVTTLDTQLMLLATPMLAQFVLLPAWGGAIDAIGRKPVFMLAGLGLAPVGLGWVFLQPSDAWWLGFVLAGASTALWTGIELANFDLQLEKSGTAYAAVNSVIVNLCGCVGSIGAGLVAQSLQHWSWQPMAGLKTFSFFDVLFILTAAVRFAAVVVFVPGMSGDAGVHALHALRHLQQHMGGSIGRGLQWARAALRTPIGVSE
jgi:MFS family permease